MNDSWIVALQNWGIMEMVQVSLAALLASIIGLERETHGHSAGLRTTMLIGIGSCLFTTLSIHAFPIIGASQDTARVAAQIVTGVGFLGTGALFRDQNRTKGLTTAATIWVVAALGMAVGVGAYALAVFSTALVFITLRILQPISQRLSTVNGEPHPHDQAQDSADDESDDDNG